MDVWGFAVIPCAILDRNRMGSISFTGSISGIACKVSAFNDSTSRRMVMLVYPTFGSLYLKQFLLGGVFSSVSYCTCVTSETCITYFKRDYTSMLMIEGKLKIGSTGWCVCVGWLC
jgi:hypothetical protein